MKIAPMLEYVIDVFDSDAPGDRTRDTEAARSELRALLAVVRAAKRILRSDAMVDGHHTVSALELSGLRVLLDRLDARSRSGEGKD